jgi:two-component system chemotaxis sensor kinase CheA
MSDFSGDQELLKEFLTEAGELLADVDNKLVELEKHPDDAKLLNDIFRGFHTIKGGAGFLNVEELVKLCHLTENLFDRLRNHEIPLNAELMDVILSATMGVRNMFGYLERRALPHRADPALLAALKEGVEGNLGKATQEAETVPMAHPATPAAETRAAQPGDEPDWQRLYDGLLDRAPAEVPVAAAPPAVHEVQTRGPGRRASDQPEAEPARATASAPAGGVRRLRTSFAANDVERSRQAAKSCPAGRTY